MRPFAAVALVFAAAACRPAQDRTEPATAASAIDFKDASDLEPLSGQSITIEGIFSHINNGEHGVLTLEGGLRIYLPHFNLFKRGDDYYKYVGKPCVARGVLHTYTRDIDGYRGPNIQLAEFYGPSE